MYAITGATGKVGKFIVSELLAYGKKVRAIARDTYRLRDLANKGATPLSGDLNDPEFVKRALSGTEAVSLLIPENPKSGDFRAEARRIAANYLNAVKQNNIKHVLLLSTLSSPLGSKAGIDETGYILEQQFNGLSGVQVLNLRSAFHMENLLSQVEMINHTGTAGGPLKSSVSFPQVCTDDVGKYAARRLNELNFKGNTIEYLLGQRDLNPNEMASILGKYIGRPDLKYVQLKGNEFINGFKQIGFSENVARAILDWADNVNNGRLSEFYRRTPQNTTPTTFEQFAEYTFAAEYHMHEVTI
jgi:uncharacterized protein YbjT (DUF2867 family)